eukprot:2737617-Pyramimonas_sp.AAC.1
MPAFEVRCVKINRRTEIKGTESLFKGGAPITQGAAQSHGPLFPHHRAGVPLRRHVPVRSHAGGPRDGRRGQTHEFVSLLLSCVMSSVRHNIM